MKLVRGAPVRMKKLTRDMVLFWKRNDKEQVRSWASALRRADICIFQISRVKRSCPLLGCNAVFMKVPAVSQEDSTPRVLAPFFWHPLFERVDCMCMLSLCVC